MKILSIDTALGACSAAVLDTDTHAACLRSDIMQRGHAEALMPMVRDVMAEANLDFAQLDQIAVTTGPGTFTGIRVGVAAARGIALAAGIPAAGFGTLETYARGLIDDPPGQIDAAPFAVALDARKGEIYLQTFEWTGAAVTDPCVAAPADAVPVVPDNVHHIAGSGALMLIAALSDFGTAPALPLAAITLPPGPDVLALARLAAEKPAGENRPAPLYLRAPDAKPQPKPSFARSDAP